VIGFRGTDQLGRRWGSTVAGAGTSRGHTQSCAAKRLQHEVVHCLVAGVALTALTALCYRLQLNLATASLLLVIVVALASRTGGLVSPVVISIMAALCLAHFAAPAYSFRVDDPFDLVAVIAFVVTSLTISRLVAHLRTVSDEVRVSVNRKLVDAEERERAQVARALHDDIGQRIALLQVKLEQLRTDAPAPTVEVRNTIEELLKQGEDLSADVQALADTLHSPKLECLGLVKTMKSFCREFGRHHKVEIDFKSQDLPSPLPSEVSLSLFRVMQEALNNSAKHSGVQRFEVDLFEGEDAIHLVVRDSGSGFDPEAAINHGGLGLMSMQQRIKLVNGNFSIHSQLERGTTLHAIVPLGSRTSSARAAR
jgi:signal transduction histidine kinase